ncbi:translation initiation factor [Fulvivirga sedimenti]|uniref:Translation initiation factor n=1 Tax=Fulvivirga sedimenti TaxID=2879465 RepID=A0A9X1HWK6_9BACT|nr:translation initiation factor [Fulvivirga sedimenti]MCA6075357.1 translation initiation factor [Fulvivirga sedimenti]MCA6076534.1 translation initiation factor [Fulvivirga sedimenti]MCA6077662.1 translation initiation factor [Fulvivirga sedimenti]
MARKRNNDWKKRDGIVFSTSENFDYEYSSDKEESKPAPANQKLRLMLDTKSRAGKKVTLIQGFRGSEEDLKQLGKSLKSFCGVGGSIKDGEILLQGDFRDKARQYLMNEGYKVS